MWTCQEGAGRVEWVDRNNDHACAGIFQERPSVPRRADRWIEGAGSPVGTARTAASRADQGSRAPERTRRVGDRKATPRRHLWQRPLDDRGQVVLLLLAARVDAL